MKYKGYTAVVELDEEHGVLFGRVIGLRDVITFQAETVPQAIEEFHASVDSYLELCRSRKESPEKPYSGNFVVRLDPVLHRQIATLAEERAVSINSLVEKVIREAVVTQEIKLERPEETDEQKRKRALFDASLWARRLAKEVKDRERLKSPKGREAKPARQKPKAPRR